MLKTRILTATILVAALLLALFILPPWGWRLVCAGILAVACWEWAALSGMRGFKRVAFALPVVACGLAITAYWPSLPGFGDVGAYYLASLVFWVLIMPPWLKNGLRSGNDSLVAATGVLVLLCCFLAMVHLHRIGPEVLLRFMAIVWIADSAAYFAGRRFGRHKLAPSISPGKTWEGVAGAMLAVTAYGILWLYVFNWGAPAVVQAVSGGSAGMFVILWFLAALSVLGDLFESALKRRAGVKDSGKILPGHGGVLDRIDALIPVLPIATLLLII
jgi:phosphatidate cytidylyltransferase